MLPSHLCARERDLCFALQFPQSAIGCFAGVGFVFHALTQTLRDGPGHRLDGCNVPRVEPRRDLRIELVIAGEVEEVEQESVAVLIDTSSSTQTFSLS